MLSLWSRLPVIVRAVLAGSVLAIVGTVPWAILVSENQKFLPSVPWSVIPTALYVWFLWRWARGEGWPRATAESRRTNARANHLSADVWGAAIFAGILGLVALLLFQSVLNRMVTLPQQQEDMSGWSFVSVFFVLLMGSTVAGVVEEVAFRGYMQGPIERRHGPVVAILVTGILFGFAHFTHPEVTLVLLPFYLGVAAIYGTLAYLTNSIWPGMVLHAGGNVMGGIGLFAAGQSVWQASTTPTPLIWETGTDASFWISCGAFVIAAAATVSAYVALASVARSQVRGNLRLRDV